MESNTGTGPAGEEQDVRKTAFCVGDTSTHAILVADVLFFFTLMLVMLETCPPLCIFDYYELLIIIYA